MTATPDAAPHSELRELAERLLENAPKSRIVWVIERGQAEGQPETTYFKDVSCFAQGDKLWMNPDLYQARHYESKEAALVPWRDYFGDGIAARVEEHMLDSGPSDETDAGNAILSLLAENDSQAARIAELEKERNSRLDPQLLHAASDAFEIAKNELRKQAEQAARERDEAREALAAARKDAETHADIYSERTDDCMELEDALTAIATEFGGHSEEAKNIRRIVFTALEAHAVSGDARNEARNELAAIAEKGGERG